jgi:8-oxo-dGTP diphosphatase
VTVVRAGGGLVHRRRQGELEVLLVHRPKYDDWSFPKGKAHEGERDEDCALREVAEETGLRCELGPELPSTSYVDGQGRPKLVRSWAMTPLAGAFAPHDEVDELEWLPLEAAARRLTWSRDLPLLAALAEIEP